MTIEDLSIYSVCAPVLMGVLLFKKLKFEFKLLVYLVVFLAISELTAVILMKRSVNNLWIFHLYTWVEFTIILSIYYRISKNRIWRFSLLGFGALFYSFSVVNVLLLEGVEEFNSFQRYLEGILIIIFCIGYYSQLLKGEENIFLERVSMFWLNSGYLFYFAGTLFLFLLNRIMTAEQDSKYWDLHNLLNISLNLIYTISLWLGSRRLTPS